MADTKTTALTENTTPLSTDIMYMVDDPGSSPLSQKITLANLSTFVKSTGGRVLIAQLTPTGTSASFTSIPATFWALRLEGISRTDRSGVAYDEMKITLNNDTTATNYRYTRFGTSSSSQDTNDIAVTCGNTAGAGSAGQITIDILNYAGTTFNKQIHAYGSYREGATAENFFIYSNEWESTVAVNRVDLICTGNFVAGSTFRLYGIY